MEVEGVPSKSFAEQVRTLARAGISKVDDSNSLCGMITMCLASSDTETKAITLEAIEILCKSAKTRQAVADTKGMLLTLTLMADDDDRAVAAGAKRALNALSPVVNGSYEGEGSSSTTATSEYKAPHGGSRRGSVDSTTGTASSSHHFRRLSVSAHSSAKYEVALTLHNGAAKRSAVGGLFSIRGVVSQTCAVDGDDLHVTLMTSVHPSEIMSDLMAVGHRIDCTVSVGPPKTAAGGSMATGEDSENVPPQTSMPAYASSARKQEPLRPSLYSAMNMGLGGTTFTQTQTSTTTVTTTAGYVPSYQSAPPSTPRYGSSSSSSSSASTPSQALVFYKEGVQSNTVQARRQRAQEVRQREEAAKRNQQVGSGGGGVFKKVGAWLWG